MAKPMQSIKHNPNCDCCGKQATFQELGRRPSGFGPLKSAPLPKKHTPHATTKSPERAGTAIERRKSLQHGIEAARETSPQETYTKLIAGDHTTENIAKQIAEDVEDRNMLQAKESRLQRTSKDKEALLEECYALKNALCDQLYHLQLHKVHHESVYLEQRRMEIAIEELEVRNGLEAPRTGGFARLKSKINGLKCRQQEYYVTLTTLRDDLETLKKDPRVSFTNEADVERDVFATETRRLQKLVRYLRTIYHKVCTENNEVVRLRENIAKLEKIIAEIQSTIKGIKDLVEQMKKDIDKAKADAIEAQRNTRNAMYKASELEGHSSVLNDMLVREKQAGVNIQRQSSSLAEQTRMVRQSNADAAMAAATAQAAADAAAADAAAAAAKAARGNQAGSKAGRLKQAASDSETGGSKSPSDSDLDSEGSGKGGKGGKGGTKGAAAAAKKAAAEEAARAAAEAEAARLAELEASKAAQEEAKRLAAELEALRKAASPETWLKDLTIAVDGVTLKPNEYRVDVSGSSSRIDITSPGRSPQALAEKAAEDAARAKKAEEAAAAAAAEDAARAAAEAEAKRKKDAEAAAAQAAAAQAAAAQAAAAQAAAATAAKAQADAADAAAAAAAAAEAGKKEFFDDKMQGVIQKNIKEVLGHLETISETVQQKVTTSGTAESTAKDILDKLDKPSGSGS